MTDAAKRTISDAIAERRTGDDRAEKILGFGPAPRNLERVFTGCAEFDLLLPDDSRSLKAKRSYVRPIVAALRKFDVAAAEVGDQRLHGRSTIGVAAVAGDNQHVREILDACERHMAGRPEVELLGVHRRVFGPEDDQ